MYTYKNVYIDSFIYIETCRIQSGIYVRLLFLLLLPYACVLSSSTFLRVKHKVTSLIMLIIADSRPADSHVRV